MSYSVTTDIYDSGFIEREKVKDSLIKEYVNLKTTIESNKRLYQHYVAIKYKNANPTPDIIKAFLKEAKIENPERAYMTATLETANGKAGTGRPPLNNHFGMKRANYRFQWASGYRGNQDAFYESWVYSYLDFQEYQLSSKEGIRKSWQKKANKL
jgi:hypothetical protein